MASSKRKLVASGVYLPYTPDDALYVARTGLLDYGHTVAPARQAGNFYLADLAGGAILSWPPELPIYDLRGHPRAKYFESWKRAQDSKVGIAGNYYSVKGSGKVPCHSSLEHGHLSCFEMNPAVVEIRTQYPEWQSSLYTELKTANVRMPKRGVMTIDFMLTLQVPGASGFRYHGISTKPAQLLAEPATIRRHKREAALLAEWGCTHEIMTEHNYSRREITNNRRLLQYMLHVEDISEYKDIAIFFSQLIFRDAVHRSADAKIGMIAHQCDVSLNEGYRIFAIANFLGYLTLDHRYELLPNKPLRLLADVHSRGNNE